MVNPTDAFGLVRVQKELQNRRETCKLTAERLRLEIASFSSPRKNCNSLRSFMNLQDSSVQKVSSFTKRLFNTFTDLFFLIEISKHLAISFLESLNFIVS